MPKTTFEKRRKVVKGMFGAALAAFAAPIAYITGKYLSYTSAGRGGTSVTVSAMELTPDKPSKLVELNGEPVLVIRNPQNEIRAFTATCTHLGCTVSWRNQMPGAETPGFYCKCHQGKYDADGVNVPGSRPKRPLTELTVLQEGDDLQVEFKPKTKA